MRGRTLTEGPVLFGLLTFCGPVLLALILAAACGFLFAQRRCIG